VQTFHGRVIPQPLTIIKAEIPYPLSSVYGPGRLFSFLPACKGMTPAHAKLCHQRLDKFTEQPTEVYRVRFIIINLSLEGATDFISSSQGVFHCLQIIKPLFQPTKAPLIVANCQNSRLGACLISISGSSNL
jgi:hypothetical protein